MQAATGADRGHPQRAVLKSVAGGLRPRQLQPYSLPGGHSVARLNRRSLCQPSKERVPAPTSTSVAGSGTPSGCGAALVATTVTTRSSTDNPWLLVTVGFARVQRMSNVSLGSMASPLMVNDFVVRFRLRLPSRATPLPLSTSLV